MIFLVAESKAKRHAEAEADEGELSKLLVSCWCCVLQQEVLFVFVALPSTLQLFNLLVGF